MTIPLVSICSLAYNHAPYIRQCLDGFVMQKTNFPIEFIIHDDASTDGTADIIREYEHKYPDIIKPIYQTENQFSKGINFGKNLIIPRIQGKYFALCEGDDYWTDEYKLQKQIDFLEANKDFSICYHPVKMYKQEEGVFVESYWEKLNYPDITDIKMLAENNHIHTASVIYRYDRKIFEELYNFSLLPVGDYQCHMLFAKSGKIKRLPDTMAVYRMHKNSIWGLKTIDYQVTIWLKVLESLLTYFNKERDIFEILKKQYIRTANGLFSIHANNKGDIPQYVFDQIKNYSEEIFYTIIKENIIENCTFKNSVYGNIIEYYGNSIILTFILRCYRKVNFIGSKISHYIKNLFTK